MKGPLWRPRVPGTHVNRPRTAPRQAALLCKQWSPPAGGVPGAQGLAPQVRPGSLGPTQGRTEWCPGLGSDAGGWGCRSVRPWGRAFPRLWPLQGEEREARDAYSSRKFQLPRLPAGREALKGPRGGGSLLNDRAEDSRAACPQAPRRKPGDPHKYPKKALMGFRSSPCVEDSQHLGN